MVPAVANPFVDWLVDEAWQPRTIPELLEQFAELLQGQDFPVWRVRLLIQTLHPQLFALTFTWQRELDDE